MRKRHNGFTLVELLVVIGIIAVLIGILMPVLSAVRSRSDRTACQAQLRNIGAAFAMYMADSKDILPYVNTTPSVQPPPNNYPSIVKLMQPYIKTATEVFHCRCDRITKITENAPTGFETYYEREGSSYQYDPFVAMLGGTHATVKSPYALGHPELITIMGEYEPFHGKVGDYGSTNYLFADGHVGFLD